jgi:formylglycine-generating enzyme required for sulfatase activity/tetratricopeptide (TPR) repeat protein
VSRIESAQGLIAERFAFCQTMPLDEFLTVAEELRKSGYRPVLLRPFADGPAVQVAAVWARDGRSWRMKSGLAAEEVRKQDETNRNETFLPVDVAGYQTSGHEGKPVDRYAAVWVEQAGDDARMYAGTTADEVTEVQDRLKTAKLIPRTVQAMRGSDGRLRYSGVWGRPPEATVTGQGHRDRFERTFEQDLADQGDELVLDVVVSTANQPQTIRERAQAALERADKVLKTKPDDLNARLARALANFRLGANQKAVEDLQVVIGKNPDSVAAQAYRAIALARLGKKLEALAELAKLQKGEVPEHSRLHLAAVVAAELGEGTEEAIAALDAAIQKEPQDAELRSDVARALALASKAIAQRDPAQGRHLAERALRLLREAVQTDDADFGEMDEDPDLDPIRDDPAFAAIMKAGHPDRRYAAVWSSDAHFEASPIYGVDPPALLSKCRDLITQGYRPVSLSVSRPDSEGPLVTATVWHRPVVEEEVKDRLAERQARAAVALVRLGHADEVWPRLQHSPDPRLRSFLVNWLSPLGAEGNAVIAALLPPRPAVRGEGGRRPGEASSMDAILFHPETSIRRALILVLGTYGPDRLSPDERQPLIARLLDLYEHDPDAGIHGAAEWTLRQWNQPAKLQEIDARLKGKDRGGRRWFINGQGQTFVLVEGRVEFRMGSPPNESDRHANERPHRRVIPRRFALADKEVSVEQYQRFVKDHPQFGLTQSDLDRYSPDPTGPMVGVTWYGAAAYCNWLSHQEGLPEDQWCYQLNERKAYDRGMIIPANVLQRRGYRLPAEAEWEYACRAGAMTSRSYAHSVDLLGKYAWFIANSHEHAWPGGSLKPNDLGLFDMLGNVYEWCQERAAVYQPGRMESPSYDIIDDTPRLLRGGAFTDRPASVRSAYRGRIWVAPTGRLINYGFRLARTYN